MAALTGTVQKLTELSGRQRIAIVTATIGSASDTITISEASYGFSSITGILGVAITGGLDAAFTNVQVTRTSATVLTITSVEQDGTAATDWTGTTVSIGLLVE